MRVLVVFIFVISLIYSSYASNCLTKLVHRSHNGECNNLLFPSRGKSGSFFIVGSEGRQYYPQIYIPRVEPLPTYANMHLLPENDINGNTRRISNILGQPFNPNLLDSRNKTLLEVFFAQFVGHDMENNRFVNPGQGGFQGNFVDYIKDRNDELCTYEGVYRCNDNDTVLTTNAQQSDGVHLPDGTFKVINNATSFLDLNGVYGDNDEINAKLRTHYGGKLIMNKERVFNVTMFDGDTISYTLKDFLPLYDELPLPLDRLFTLFSTKYAVVSGEHRVNTNMGIGIFHVLFLREHNRVCDELMNKNVLWKLFPQIFDEVIYQRARTIVIAKYQKIIYEQYLPSLLGENKYKELGEYKGYNPLVDPTTSITFSSVAFRYGHYLMDDFPGLDECDTVYKDGKPSDDPNYKPIHLGACNPTPDVLTHIGRVVEYGSYENIIRGLIGQVHLSMNFTMHPIVRTIPNVRGGFDLTAIDIMRGRYNSIPVYLKLRRTYYKLGDQQKIDIYGNDDCPLHLETDEDQDDPLECFMYITSNIDKALKLKEAYGKVIYIDGIVGVMIEEHNSTTSIGDTAANIIIDQFRRTRDGDRFFYKQLLNSTYFTLEERNEILNTTLGSLLRRNFNGDHVDFPDNPFIRPIGYRESLRARCQ